jgi:hypothetical protein
MVEQIVESFLKLGTLVTDLQDLAANNDTI